jgi:hypothetical protein
MCPHTSFITAICVSSYCLERVCCCSKRTYAHNKWHVSSYCYMCVLILHMCPHPTICVLILLYRCPHTTIHVSSYCYVCVRILLYMCPHTAMCVRILLYMCPHTAICVSAYYYTCVLILLYMCPHTAIYVSSDLFSERVCFQQIYDASNYQCMRP